MEISQGANPPAADRKQRLISSRNEGRREIFNNGGTFRNFNPKIRPVPYHPC